MVSLGFFLKLPRLNYYLTSGPIFLAMLYRDLGKRILKICDVSVLVDFSVHVREF